MANTVRYSCSIDIIDEYTEASTFTGEHGGEITKPSVTRERFHPTVKGSKGGSGNNVATVGVVSHTDVVCTSSGTSLGTMTTVTGVCIKHTGFLADDTTVAVTDRAVPGNTQSLLILSSGGDILGELWPNEAMLFLRPQYNFKIKSGRTGEHVAAQVTLLGT